MVPGSHRKVCGGVEWSGVGWWFRPVLGFSFKSSWTKCFIEKTCMILLHAQWQSSPKLITYLILLYSPVHEVPDLVPVPREGETDHHWWAGGQDEAGLVGPHYSTGPCSTEQNWLQELVWDRLGLDGKSGLAGFSTTSTGTAGQHLALLSISTSTAYCAAMYWYIVQTLCWYDRYSYYVQPF